MEVLFRHTKLPQIPAHETIAAVGGLSLLVGHGAGHPAGTFRARPQSGSRGLEAVDRRRFDVVIVGAGYTGLSAARQLARAGASVVVLDRGQVGSGASSRNAGQVLTGLKLESADSGRRRTARHGRASSSRSPARRSPRLNTSSPTNGSHCDLERTGHLQAAAKPSHLRAFRRRAGAARASLQSPGVHRRSSRSIDGAWRSRLSRAARRRTERARSTRRSTCTGSAGAATRAGAAIVEHTAVSRMTRTATGWTVDDRARRSRRAGRADRHQRLHRSARRRRCNDG